jgi:hypothetical protein
MDERPRPLDGAAGGRSGWPLALSVAAGGVATVATLALATGGNLSAAVGALVSARPQMVFSVLIGPTGLSFPCWAALRRDPARLSLGEPAE